jgi:hypothetical protein
VEPHVFCTLTKVQGGYGPRVPLSTILGVEKKGSSKLT